MSESIPELELLEFEEGEVGEPVIIELPTGTIQATWLGTVSNGKELARAMRLMIDLDNERKAEAESATVKG